MHAKDLVLKKIHSFTSWEEVPATLQAMEAVKYITGVGELLSGYLLTYDALKMEFHKIKLPPRGIVLAAGFLVYIMS